MLAETPGPASLPPEEKVCAGNEDESVSQRLKALAGLPVAYVPVVALQLPAGTVDMDLRNIGVPLSTEMVADGKLERRPLGVQMVEPGRDPVEILSLARQGVEGGLSRAFELSLVLIGRHGRNRSSIAPG